MKLSRARLIVEGIVQGVSYRWFVRDQAKRLGINGTVQNLPDGTVEIICEADTEEKLKEFIASISKGRFLGHKVDKVTRSDYTREIKPGFEILF